MRSVCLLARHSLLLFTHSGRRVVTRALCREDGERFARTEGGSVRAMGKQFAESSGR